MVAVGRYTLLENLLFLPSSVHSEKLRHSIDGKTVLITGASSGIGEQLSRLLGEYDLQLILVARRYDRLLKLKEELEQKKARVCVFQADLREEREMEAFLAFLYDRPNGIDIVVNNAGLSIGRSIWDSLDRFHDFSRTMAINYFAPVRMLLSLIPMLERAKGQIINISTINTSLIPLPNWAAYQASKTAFDTWFRSAAPELNAAGIFTTSIYLPLVRTPMIEPTAAYKSMPAMNPEHVARIIAKSMYTKRRTWQPWWLFMGQAASLVFRGWWEKRMPRKLRKRRRGHGNR